MNVKLLGQLRQRAIALNRRQRHLRLERTRGGAVWDVGLADGRFFPGSIATPPHVVSVNYFCYSQGA